MVVLMRIYILFILGILSGCAGGVDGQPIPQDQLYYPSVLLKNNNTLYVVNTNLDLQYSSGSISEIDLVTKKISQKTTIPSLAGQAVASSDFSTLLTTSQHTSQLLNAFSNTSLSTPQNGPYFLALIPGTTNGLMGYLMLASNEPWDDNRFSLAGKPAELEYFAFDPKTGLSIAKSFSLADCFPPPARPYRRIGRIGGIQITKKNAYILAEFFIDDSERANQFLRHVFLIKSPISDLQKGVLSCTNNANRLDLSLTEKAQAARGLQISADETKAYIILDENPLLLTVDLTQNSIINRVETCKSPTTLKLSPDSQTLAISCSKANQLVAYNATDLAWFGKYNGGNGPLDILFDPDKAGQIFVSYQQDNQIGIFKYENQASYFPKRSLDFVQWLQLSR